MQTPVEVLSREAEPVPGWLVNYQAGALFPREAFFSSRILYYPASGTDGNPLRLFSKAHAVHCFVYVDIDDQFLDTVRQELIGEKRPAGYEVLSITDLNEGDLLKEGWKCTLPVSTFQHHCSSPPIGLFVVLRRKDNLTNDHGPERLCILHLQWEAVTAFDELFCQGVNELPYGLVLETDYGFSQQEVARFLELAKTTEKTPSKWLVISDYYAGDLSGYTLKTKALVITDRCRLLYERD
jgi:hypothetical protein